MKFSAETRREARCQLLCDAACKAIPIPQVVTDSCRQRSNLRNTPGLSFIDQGEGPPTTYQRIAAARPQPHRPRPLPPDAQRHCQPAPLPVEALPSSLKSPPRSRRERDSCCRLRRSHEFRWRYPPTAAGREEGGGKGVGLGFMCHRPGRQRRRRRGQTGEEVVGRYLILLPRTCTFQSSCSSVFMVLVFDRNEV